MLGLKHKLLALVKNKKIIFEPIWKSRELQESIILKCFKKIIILQESKKMFILEYDEITLAKYYFILK